MPTYEYHCEKCKKNFELFQSMKDDALTTCPREQCRQKTWGKGKVRRLLGTGAGLIFKGSGFYITDYRSEGYKEAAKKDASSSAPPKPADSKPSDSKPDSTPKPTPPAPKAAAPAAEPRKSKKKE
jgi:putative FmdB family regulatory protein